MFFLMQHPNPLSGERRGEEGSREGPEGAEGREKESKREESV